MFTLQDVSNLITVVPNFPKEGIMFRDITNLMLDNKLFDFAIDKMVELVEKSGLKPDYIAGFESRGFLFNRLCSELNCGFVMIRKPNKLPNSISYEYDKEYGTDTLTITKCIPKNSKILLIDDLLATGGTIQAGRKLIEMIDCVAIGCINLIELVGLESKIKTPFPTLSLLKYRFDDTLTLLDNNLNYNVTIKKYEPLIIDSVCQTIVFSHPSLNTLSDNFINSELDARRGTILWDSFPDSQPNIRFEHMDQLENKKIVFFLSLCDTKLLFQQLSLLMVLPRQFIKSLDIYITYFSVGTMERVDEEGILATAETMAKIISSCIETTKFEKPTIHIWDIHALPIRFYFNTNNVIIKLHSAIPMLISHISSNSIIVFPDDGAYKRFKNYFSQFKIIVCSKVRIGNKRVINIVDKLHFPENDDNCKYDEVIIVDDLVQSGGTLCKCKEALEKYGYNNISAFVTHAVFPNDGWRKMESANFNKFYTTNTVPETTDKLVNNSKFKIFSLFDDKYKAMKMPLIIYVASHNEQKNKAVFDAFTAFFPNKTIIVYGVNVLSNINEQPINDETITGCINRQKNLLKFLKDNNKKYSYTVSIENGLFENKDAHVISITNKNIEISASNLSNSTTIVPQHYIDMCKVHDYKIKIGEIIERETGISKDNWHQHFGSQTRLQSMIQTIHNLII